MTERLKKIPKQLLEMWNKYTTKQKTLIISATCVVILAFALLIFLMNRVEYSQLKVCETATEMADIADLLDGQGIKNRIDKDTLTISVESKSYDDAFMLLAKSDISTDDISIDELLGNSLSTTNADRTLKVNLYFQNKLRNKIKEMEGIEDAEVYYIPKESDTSILQTSEDTSASVLLTVNDDFKPETAQTIAQVVASVIGNESAESIKVSDQNGNLLYGGEQDLYTGTANSTAEYEQKLRSTFINNLYMILIKSGYDDVEVAPYLKFDNDKVTELYTEYSAPDGMEQGLYSYSKTNSSQNTNSTDGGVPGTSSNDGTSYATEDSSSSGSKSQSEEYKYLPNERKTNTEYEVGAVIPDQSSIGIVLTRVNTYKQEDLESDGTLKGTTLNAYVKANSALTPLTVDAGLVTLVSNATGISEDKITINAYEQSVFIPSTTTTRSWTDYLQIALVVLIVGLLLFVVFKGVAPVEVTELEPELSVEQLLATTKENQTIEDIEFNEVSEVRRMIEKFVDEKPESVAQLLRNWLNEDWN
jgi:flagellar M-ring protein FliF